MLLLSSSKRFVLHRDVRAQDGIEVIKFLEVNIRSILFLLESHRCYELRLVSFAATFLNIHNFLGNRFWLCSLNEVRRSSRSSKHVYVVDYPHDTRTIVTTQLLYITKVVDDEVITTSDEEVNVLEHATRNELEDRLLVRILCVLEVHLFHRTETVGFDERPYVGQELFRSQFRIVVSWVVCERLDSFLVLFLFSIHLTAFRHRHWFDQDAVQVSKEKIRGYLWVFGRDSVVLLEHSNEVTLLEPKRLKRNVDVVHPIRSSHDRVENIGKKEVQESRLPSDAHNTSSEDGVVVDKRDSVRSDRHGCEVVVYQHSSFHIPSISVELSDESSCSKTDSVPNYRNNLVQILHTSHMMNKKFVVVHRSDRVVESRTEVNNPLVHGEVIENMSNCAYRKFC